jgi:hypothetical protein
MAEKAVAGDGSVDVDPPVGAPDDDAENDSLLLDQLTERLDSLKLLRHSGDEASANAQLEQFGAKGKVEQEILQQLSAWKPLYRPERFEQAHRTAMRALEVFDRNGARAVKVPRLGPLTFFAEFFTQLVCRWIVRNYQADVVDSIRHLYGRREANSIKGSAEQMMLLRARRDAERLAPGFKRNPLGLPTFLFGGAVISSLFGALGDAISTAFESVLVAVIAVVVMCLLFLGAAWVILRAAATARIRTHLALDQPLKALWETIGAAGNPPKDDSRNFALYSIVLLGLAWLLVPLGLFVFVFR